MTDQSSMKALQLDSFLFAGNAAYLEQLYETYLRDPSAIPAEWKHYFETMPNGTVLEESHQAIREHFRKASRFPKLQHRAGSGDAEHVRKQGCVSQLITAYRSHGHHLATLDPLKTSRAPRTDLELAYHGLGQEDLNTNFSSSAYLGITKPEATLKEIIDTLQKNYCNNIGIEYAHITDPEQIRWIEERFESCCGRGKFSTVEKKTILKQLIAAEELERYLGNKYVGQKRFSLEGGDSLIPMLSQVVHRCGAGGVKELVIGMAHRGRLNVLINVLGKAPSALFQEFEGKLIDESRTGDVKYHLGFSSDIQFNDNLLHLTLGFNPSHLEIISPVIIGSVRARQERRSDKEHDLVVPLIIHGDAAIAGQGVVMETLNMSQARGYRVGGTVHLIINNQVGFTTSNPLDARSTLYCTDIGKLVQAPILHVNGDDPEACVFAMQLALDFRMRFKKDVFVDLVCYRRHGHNESDEPAMTQPVMYQHIREHKSTVSLYGEQLEKEQVLEKAEIEKYKADYRNNLDQGHPVINAKEPDPKAAFSADWRQYLNQDWTAKGETKVGKKRLQELATKITTIPEGFTLQRQVEREYAARRKMLAGEIPMNWGFAENLAYASLLDEEYGVRLSGQDSGRGTFTHRHAVLHDYNTAETYIPLAHLRPTKNKFTVIDSVLSEEGVLAFEYGYATAEPQTLVLWEAQFGDFVNGAQVVIDQFISSGYQKWGRLCGLVMLLPHGYEGMGPEHSSARLERFLQLCAQHNIQVCVPTTPAQCFHMLRRQLVRPFRKPLIVMTPKSLLRHKLAVSSLDELAEGEFQLVIPEIDLLENDKVERIVVCSGKVYYDLLEARREKQLNTVAIIRVEQLYPFPENELLAAIASYPNGKTVVWCQEEPKNQGSWYSCNHHFKACIREQQTLIYAGREAAAAPAVGYMSMHARQQEQLVNEALGLSNQ